MTHLNIQQGLNIEVVSTNLIKKLYEAALSVPEPLEGELDAAYMSGNLLVDKTYRSYVLYLTGRFDDLHINVTGSYYILFEDSAVLNVLLANNIGSDGIGITEAEAANATLTAAMFLNNTDITSFDEFKYFTKANTNPPSLLFMGCNNLSSIDLSNVTKCSNEEFKNSGLTGTLNLPNLTSIGQEAFCSCSNITGSLNLPNLTSLNNSSFWTSGITGITNLGSVTAIPQQCFLKCTHLTSVILPNTCTTIDKYGFSGCTNLTSINLGGVTTLGYSAFENDSNLTSVTGIENLTTIEKRAFCKCGLTGTLDLRNVSVLGNYPFYKCNITKIKLPSTFSNITFRNANLEWNIQNKTNDTGDLFIGLPLLTTIETDFTLWTTFPKFRGCYNLVPFVLYLPNVTFINAAIIGGGYHVDQHWGNMSWNSSFYYPNVTEVHSTSGSMYINHNKDNQGLFSQGDGNVLIDLLYLKSTLTLNYASFYHVTSGKIVINNTTVPTVVSNSQGSSTTTTVNYFVKSGTNDHVDFYVPDSAVNDYKAAWPNHASDIYGISQLNGGVIYATEADYNSVSTNVLTKPVGLIAEYMGLSSADLATFVSANNLTYWTNPNA